MKVKITYTVDLSEVPNKANPLLDTAAAESKELLERICALKDLKNESIDKCLKEIADIRKTLMNIDFALDDCDAMLTGYLKTLVDGSSYPEIQNVEEQENG